VAETSPQIIVCHPAERMAVRNGGAVAKRVRHDDDDDDGGGDGSTSFCRANGPKDAAELFLVAGMSSRIGVRAEVSRQSFDAARCRGGRKTGESRQTGIAEATTAPESTRTG